MDKETRNQKVEIRLTPKEKEQLRAYAEERHLTMSEAIRWLCETIFQKESEKQ